MISKMEACQTKMCEAITNVQATSIAAIHATSPGTMSSPRATTVGAMVGVAPVAPEVMVVQAKVVMLKLPRILNSKNKKA